MACEKTIFVKGIAVPLVIARNIVAIMVNVKWNSYIMRNVFMGIILSTVNAYSVIAVPLVIARNAVTKQSS
jgi:hypothetical protein